jgi:hypothetical protein
MQPGHAGDRIRIIIENKHGLFLFLSRPPKLPQQCVHSAPFCDAQARRWIHGTEQTVKYRSGRALPLMVGPGRDQRTEGKKERSMDVFSIARGLPHYQS